MTLPLASLPIFLAIISTLANMLGIEGGSLVMPLLIYLYGVSSRLGSGAVVVAQIVGLGLGSVNYWRQRRIDWGLTRFILTATVPGALFGSYLVHLVSDRVITLVVAAILLAAGGRFAFFRQWRWPSAALGPRRTLTDGDGKIFRYRHARKGIAWPFFALAGTLQGISGTGIGVVQMPVLLFVMEIPAHIAVATSVLAMATSSFAATAGHVAFARIPWKITAYLIPGVLVGSQLGPFLSRRLNPEHIHRLLGYMLLTIGLAIAVQTFYTGFR